MRLLVQYRIVIFGALTNVILVLQERMDHLSSTALVGGERADATDHCLAGIVRLSNEVKDAASYIPTYDQRVYAEVQRERLGALENTNLSLGNQSSAGQTE